MLGQCFFFFFLESVFFFLESFKNGIVEKTFISKLLKCVVNWGYLCVTLQLLSAMFLLFLINLSLSSSIVMCLQCHPGVNMQAQAALSQNTSKAAENQGSTSTSSLKNSQPSSGSQISKEVRIIEHIVFAVVVVVVVIIIIYFAWLTRPYLTLIYYKSVVCQLKKIPIALSFYICI